MLFNVQDVFDLYNQIMMGELIENEKEYHETILDALKGNYDLALECFKSCSVEFYMWFSKDYLYEITQIISFHKKRELLLVLKNHLLELANNNPFDKRISSIATIYHVTYKFCE